MGDPKTANIRDLLNHLAQYLETLPTLDDEEYHHLLLDTNGRLLTAAALYGWTGSIWKAVLVDADGKLEVV